MSIIRQSLYKIQDISISNKDVMVELNNLIKYCLDYEAKNELLKNDCLKILLDVYVCTESADIKSRITMLLSYLENDEDRLFEITTSSLTGRMMNSNLESFLTCIQEIKKMNKVTIHPLPFSCCIIIFSVSASFLNANGWRGEKLNNSQQQHLLEETVELVKSRTMNGIAACLAPVFGHTSGNDDDHSFVGILFKAYTAFAMSVKTLSQGFGYTGLHTLAEKCFKEIKNGEFFAGLKFPEFVLPKKTTSTFASSPFSNLTTKNNLNLKGKDNGKKGDDIRSNKRRRNNEGGWGSGRGRDDRSRSIHERGSMGGDSAEAKGGEEGSKRRSPSQGE